MRAAGDEGVTAVLAPSGRSKRWRLVQIATVEIRQFQKLLLVEHGDASAVQLDDALMGLEPVSGSRSGSWRCRTVPMKNRI